MGEDDILADLKAEGSLRPSRYRSDRLPLGLAPKEGSRGGADSYASASYDLIGNSEDQINVRRELALLKQGQTQLLSLLKQLREEIALERRSREVFQRHLLSCLSPTNGSTNVSTGNGLLSTTGSTSSSAEEKTKDLKKKLLLANLKILELQNKTEAVKR